MVNYQQGKVYKITSDQTDRVYIGSTCNPLNKRIAAHRRDYRSYLAGTRPHRITSYDVVQYDDAIIVLVEECPCENKEQLFQRERFHIENTANCVNRVIPGRTLAEWQVDNKEVICEKARAKYAANREARLAKQRIYQEAHKGAIAERMGEVIECECGMSLTRQNMSRIIRPRPSKLE